MEKDTKILIIGFGSIGKRHFNNLKVLGFRNVSVYDSNPSVYKGFDSEAIVDLSQKKLAKFSIVFICTPSHLHIKFALLAASLGCHLFIEKPLSHTLKDLSKLGKLVQSKKLTTMVAANMRFHPALAFVKSYLNKNKLGKIYRISHEFGHFLPYWRPSTDYKKGYAVKKEMGGGILLDDIHEYDLLFWLLDFKKPISSHIVKTKTATLTQNSEDQVAGLFLFPEEVIGTVSSDYLSQSYRRGITIIGEYGNLLWDFNENIVWLQTAKGKKKLVTIKNYDINEMYKEEVAYFLHCVAANKKTENDVSRAASLLKDLGIK